MNKTPTQYMLDFLKRFCPKTNIFSREFKQFITREAKELQDENMTTFLELIQKVCKNCPAREKQSICPCACHRSVEDINQSGTEANDSDESTDAEEPAGPSKYISNDTSTKEDTRKEHSDNSESDSNDETRQREPTIAGIPFVVKFVEYSNDE